MVQKHETNRSAYFRTQKLILVPAVLLLTAFVFVGAGAATITGDGSADDPFVISDLTDLNTMAGWINAGQNATLNYTLGGDIEITGTYTPIGSLNSNPFQGHFDGQNHQISGSIAREAQGAGIFGFINNASIENLVLKDLTVTNNGKDSTGALVGRLENDGSTLITTDADAIKTNYHSHIANITMNNVKVEGQNSGSANVGGLVGYANSASSLWIENVSADADCTVASGSASVGGLVGRAISASVAIVDSKCSAKSVSSSGSTYVGGLVGYANSASLKLQGCEVAGVALSGSYIVGGLVGFANSASYLNISGCEVADCTVTFSAGTANYGGAGLVGYLTYSGTPVITYLDNVMENVTVKPGYTSSFTWDSSKNVVGLVDAGANAQIMVVLSSATDSIAPLKEIVIGDNVTIRNSSVCPYNSATVKTTVVQADYANVKDKITSLSVGDKVTSIDASAFTACTNLKKITDLGAVTTIGANAFNGDTSLTTISGLDGTTSIGASAFKGCTALGSGDEKGLYLPSTITLSGSAVFDDCDALSVIYTLENNLDNVGTVSAAKVAIDDTEASVVGKLTGANIRNGTFVPNTANRFETIVSSDGLKSGLFYNSNTEEQADTYEEGESYYPVFNVEEKNLLWKIVPDQDTGISWDADEEKWIVQAGAKNVVLGVYLNTSGMDNSKPLQYTEYNLTYVADFHNETSDTDSVNLTFVDRDNWDLVYNATTALGTQSSAGFDQYAHQAGVAKAVSGRYLNKSEGLVLIGNITLNTTSMADRGLDKAYSITLNKSNTAIDEGFGIRNGSSIESEDFWATVKEDYTFNFYIGKIKLIDVAYNDGRYSYAQELNASWIDQPVFYIYEDIYTGSFADKGAFTLNTSSKKPWKFAGGYLWNTTLAKTWFDFEAENTTDGHNLTNKIKKSALVVTNGLNKNISFSLGSKDSTTGKLVVQDGSTRNSSVIVEKWMQSEINNTNVEGGWYFDTPYNVTYIVRPGPYGYNQSALDGDVAGVIRSSLNWDSGYKVANLTNFNVSEEAEVVWKFELLENTPGNVYNNYTASSGKRSGQNVMDSTQNIEVVSSNSYVGDNVTIKLTGWKLADVNKNGRVNLQDSGRIAFLAIAGMDDTGSYDSAMTAYTDATYEHCIIADCNVQGGDGVITAADVKAVNAWLAGTPIWNTENK